MGVSALSDGGEDNVLVRTAADLTAHAALIRSREQVDVRGIFEDLGCSDC